MAEEELEVVTLRDDFYRDSFGKIILIIISIVIGILLVLSLSLYLYLDKPKPILFLVGDEWRVQPAVPLDQPYRSEPDVLQWVVETLPSAFVLDFIHYNDQLKRNSQNFTTDGWNAFLNQLNIYANYNNVQTNRLFVNGTPAGAPFIVNKGLLSGRYAWWVQIPINITFTGYSAPRSQTLTLQALVVRVSTLNNLSGIGIDNVVLAQNTGSQSVGNV